jgi:hypothetical protein
MQCLAAAARVFKLSAHWLPYLMLVAFVTSGGCKPNSVTIRPFGYVAQGATEVQIRFIATGEQRVVTGHDLREILDTFVPKNFEGIAGPGSRAKIATLHYFRLDEKLCEMAYYEGAVMVQMLNGRLIYVRLKEDPIGPILTRIK